MSSIHNIIVGHLVYGDGSSSASAQAEEKTLVRVAGVGFEMGAHTHLGLPCTVVRPRAWTWRLTGAHWLVLALEEEEVTRGTVVGFERAAWGKGERRTEEAMQGDKYLSSSSSSRQNSTLTTKQARLNWTHKVALQADDSTVVSSLVNTLHFQLIA